MGFNSAFKGLNPKYRHLKTYVRNVLKTHSSGFTVAWNEKLAQAQYIFTCFL
jgi:hypothetical protein